MEVGILSCSLLHALHCVLRLRQLGAAPKDIASIFAYLPPDLQAAVEVRAGRG